MQSSLSKNSDHSLGPDFVTGWKHNASAVKLKQFPIYFTNPTADNLSKSLTSFGREHTYRVVYMGPRHSSNLKAFRSYSRNQIQEEVNDSTRQQNERILKYEFKYFQEKQKIFPIRPMEYRLFVGMNPTVKKDDLCFDGNFQSGNLDLVILVNSFEYDLLMRVDSNTKGHTSWFYFKVSNFTHKQKIRFNLINFQKSGLLYKDGMKPYCFRSSKNIWQQDGSNVDYRLKKFRYGAENDEDPTMMNCLTFTYEFDEIDQYVYFSYCIPYTYSYMMHCVQKLQRQNPHFVQIDNGNNSLGGLTIPILTITNSHSLKQKPVCLAIGRLHPGETQGSWVMDGFLKFICSSKGYYLREKLIFKIIPMVNVDGVVLGNFRTSISGRDLNRVFDSPQKYPEVNLVNEIADKKKPLIFMDFHGHSGKKNVFMYGPDYSVSHPNYLSCRLLPKLISKATNAFRYYACVFRISEIKTNAARSIMLRKYSVPYSFTIQSSSHAFGIKSQEVIFTCKQYSTVGEFIAESLIKFTKIIFILPKRLEKRQNLENQKKRSFSTGPRIEEKEGKEENILSHLLSGEKMHIQLPSQDQKLIMQLMKEQQSGNNNQQREQQREGSDSDFDEANQYSEKQLKKMFKASKMNIEQEGQIDEEPEMKKKKKKRKISPSKKNFIHKVTTQKSLQRQMSKQSVSPSFIIKDRSIKKITKESSETINPVVLKKIDSIKIRNPVSLELIASPSHSLNKVNYGNWKVNQSTKNETEQPNFAKANSVNHINMDYSLGKLDDALDQQKIKRQKQRERHIKKNFSLKQKDLQKSSSKKNQIFYINQSLLPLLSKNKFADRKASSSFLEDILQTSQKCQRSYVRKNIKILYF